MTEKHRGDASLEDAIKLILAKYDLSQGDLAKQLGKSRATISQLLSGSGCLKPASRQELISGVKQLLGARKIKLDARADEDLVFFEQILASESAGSSSDYTREIFDTFIDNKINNANNNIVFLGGLSHRKMVKDWFDIIAKRLTASKKLEVWIFVESDQFLFWRSLSLKPEHERNVRSYKDLQERYRLQCHDLRNSIKKYVSNKYDDDEKLVAEVMHRLHFYESSLPIYTFYTLIDDTLFITPRNHLRASLSSTRVIENKNSLEYLQAIECIEFYKNLAKNNRFVDDPFAEKTIVTADEGKRVYGELFRATFNQDSRLETRVAHAFVFNRRGEFLVRKRGENEFDNCGLYDKSIGGHWDVGTDVSFHSAARRELDEEINQSLVSDIRKVLLRKNIAIEYMPPPKEYIIDCGSWRGGVGIPEGVPNVWNYYLLKECERFPSTRRLQPTSRKVERMIYADIYIFLCDSEFTDFVDKACAFASKDIPCKWVSIEKADKLLQEPITDDLRQYIQVYLPELIGIASGIISVSCNEN